MKAMLLTLGLGVGMIGLTSTADAGPRGGGYRGGNYGQSYYAPTYRTYQPAYGYGFQPRSYSYSPYRGGYGGGLGYGNGFGYGNSFGSPYGYSPGYGYGGSGLSFGLSFIR